MGGLAEHIASLSGASAASSAGAPLAVCAYCVLLSSLVACVASDLKSRILPNLAVGLVALSGLLQMGAAMLGAGGPVPLDGAAERLGCALFALVLGFAFEGCWRATHAGEHGMGFGDVKLLGAMALWTGPATAYVLAAACALAVGFSAAARERKVPFGPFLAVGFLGCLVVRYACA